MNKHLSVDDVIAQHGWGPDDLEDAFDGSLALTGNEEFAWSVVERLRDMRDMDVYHEAKRLSIADLKRVIAEAMGDAAAPPKKEETGASLDAQVDRYFDSYEQEAKTAKQEGKDFRSLVKRLMREDGDDAEGKDAGAPEAASRASVNDIDIESFSNSVVRLIENFDSLLEVRSTLMRRATNFLSKVYDDEVMKEFDRVMREEHGMEAGKSPEDVSDDQFPAPAAARAGDGGTGPGGAPGA